MGQVSAGDLAVTHPIRMGLTLNYSVVLYVVLGNPDDACWLARTGHFDRQGGLQPDGHIANRCAPGWQCDNHTEQRYHMQFEDKFNRYVPETGVQYCGEIVCADDAVCWDKYWLEHVAQCGSPNHTCCYAPGTHIANLCVPGWQCNHRTGQCVHDFRSHSLGRRIFNLHGESFGDDVDVESLDHGGTLWVRTTYESAQTQKGSYSSRLNVMMANSRKDKSLHKQATGENVDDEDSSDDDRTLWVRSVGEGFAKTREEHVEGPFFGEAWRSY